MPFNSIAVSTGREFIIEPTNAGIAGLLARTITTHAVGSTS
jgi:hypothetical protein